MKIRRIRADNRYQYRISATLTESHKINTETLEK